MKCKMFFVAYSGPNCEHPEICNLLHTSASMCGSNACSGDVQILQRNLWIPFQSPLRIIFKYTSKLYVWTLLGPCFGNDNESNHVSHIYLRGNKWRRASFWTLSIAKLQPKCVRNLYDTWTKPRLSDYGTFKTVVFKLLFIKFKQFY
jgi:hypothetical protein